MHPRLEKLYRWYKAWHNRPEHVIWHWIFFITTALTLSSFTYFTINNFGYFSDGLSISLSQVKADTNNYDKLSNLTTQMLRQTSSADTSQLLTTAQTRRQSMLSAMTTNPAAVLAVALDDKSAQKMPKPIRDLLEKKVNLSGTVEILHYDDFINDKSTVEYVLNSKNKQYNLHFVGANSHGLVDDLSTGDEVNVNGIAIDDEIVVGSEAENYSVIRKVRGANIINSSSGEVEGTVNYRIAVLAFNYSSNNYTYSTNYTHDRLVTLYANIANYYNRISYGKMTLNFEVYGPYVIQANYSNCNSSPDAKVLQAAAADGYSGTYFTKVYETTCVANRSIGAGASLGPGFVHVFEAAHAIHELGHNFSVQHAHSYTCKDVNGKLVPFSSSCTSKEYGDLYSPMGANSAQSKLHHHSSHKNLRNFYETNNVKNITTSGTYTLAPQEFASTGTQHLNVNVDNTVCVYGGCFTTPQPKFTVEFRIADTTVGENTSINGVYVRYTNNGHFYLLDTTAGSITTSNDFNDADLPIGASFYDSSTGIVIKNLGFNSTTANVQVTYGAQVCVRVNPLVTITPTTQWTEPGQSVSANLTIRNEDTPACGSSTFNVTPTLPSGISQSPAISVLLAPQASTTKSITLSTASTVPVGVYQITETVKNSSSPTNQASVVANLNLIRLGSSASFVKTDSTTLGTWKGFYGAGGHLVVGDSSKYPSYAQVTINGASIVVRANPSLNLNALQKANSTDRIDAILSNSKSLNLDINLNDSNTHQMAVYLHDSQACYKEADIIDLVDADSGAPLDTKTVTDPKSGKYLVWNVSGHLILKVTNSAGCRASLTGLFFDQ